MNNLLWRPSESQKIHSNLYQFQKKLSQKFQKDFSDYNKFHAWSVSHKNLFWQEVADFCQLKFHTLPNDILQNENAMPGAQWFPGATLNFAENLLSRDDGKIALIFNNERNERRTLTYKELNEQSTKLASALQENGVGIGDRVAAYLPNTIEAIVGMLATTRLGAIWSACPPEFGLTGILDRFGQITPKVLFAIDHYFYQGKKYDVSEKLIAIAQAVPSLKKIVVVPPIDNSKIINTIPNAIAYENFLQKNAILHFTSIPFQAPVYILYSSGTTGKPKCIVHSAGGTLIQHLKELKLHTDINSEDTLFYYTTCGWMMWNWMVSSLALGATLVLYDGAAMFPNADRLIDLIDEEKITVFGTSAKFISSLEKAGSKPKATHNLSTLKTILSTGSPLAPYSFDYVYNAIKKEVCLSSISGGTDIVSCFALGNPLLPVYRGELQCIGLGMDVKVFNEEGCEVIQEKGELICESPFPSMPIYFWNDPDNKKYHKAYFERFPEVWAHGDYAEITENKGMIIYGRSDAILNPGGVRVGTAEIYRQVEKIPEILEAIVVGQPWQDDERIILFVKLTPHTLLTPELSEHIKKIIKENTSPRHVPQKIITVKDIPRTLNGKIAELAVKNTIQGLPIDNKEALANPECLEEYRYHPELQQFPVKKPFST